MSPEEILKRPYHWIVIPDEDGSFFATIGEFPGCLTDAMSPTEAIVQLREVALCWLAAVIEQGQTVPEPKVFSYFNT